MPRLWTDTIDAHRRQVRDAILDATAEIVAEGGVTAAKMSRIAEQAGIGRKTLYKYFPDVESILVAWHDRQVTSHLNHLRQVGERFPDPARRLEQLLHAHATMAYEQHGADPPMPSHGEHVADAQQRLRSFISDVVEEAAASGNIRADIRPDELTDYCLHALAAAGSRPSKASIDRLVELTLAALRPRPSGTSD